MTEAKIADLVGLAEIAERFKVTKNVASGWVRKPGFPHPEHKLAMGPMWDWKKVEAHIFTRPTFKIQDQSGNLTATVAQPACDKCGQDAKLIDNGLSLDWSPESGCRIKYIWYCFNCQDYGSRAAAPNQLSQEEA